MSDTLIGVIIGGLIASISPIASLIIDHLRWRREARLEYLKGERRRWESKYKETLNRLGQAMKEDNYPSDMITDFLVLMPKDVSDRFSEWMKPEKKSQEEGQHAYLAIALSMKKHLSEIDKQIHELVSK